MKAAWPSALIVACLVGCAQEGTKFVSLPELDPAIESVLVVERGPEVLEITAFDEDRVQLVTSSDVVEIFVLGYARPLDALGLDPGAVPIAQSTSCASGSLVPFDRGFRLATNDLEQGLVSIESLDEPLARVAFEVACPCVGFEIERYDLGELGNAYGLEVLSSDRMAVLTTDNLLTLNLDVEIVETTTIATAVDAYLASEGTVRYSSTVGRVFEWDGTEQPKLLATVPDGGKLDAIAGSAPGSPVETMVVSDLGELHVITEGTTELVASRNTMANNQLADVTWLGPGSFLAALREDTGLVQVERRGEVWVSAELPWPSASQPIGALGFLEPYGALLSTRERHFYHRPVGETEWTLLPISDVRVDSFRAFAAFRGGALFGFKGGVIQHHPSSNFCEPYALEGFRIYVIREAPDGTYWVAGVWEQGGLSTVFRLTPADL